jgi:dTDP-4-amino-4,6-dideoxygalactose transaminase
MIQLFKINNYLIDTSKYSNLLHDDVVNEFEETIAKYVGAKYAVTFNSATSAIFLALLNKNITVKVPSMIPPVVLNAIITSGNKYEFTDDVNWVGNSYILHTFDDYKIVDSAQKLEENQFKKECNPNDLMVFSFYPTKPIGTCDGGMIVSDDFEKITYLREIALNGMSFAKNNWDRKIKLAGYKMYMNSIQCDIALRNFNVYEDKLQKLSRIRTFYNNNLGYNNTSNHLYRIEVDNRDVFIQKMKENGILCGVHYDAMHLNPVYMVDNTFCPLSEEKSKKTVSIPFHEDLTNLELRFIIDTIKVLTDGNK